MVTERLPVEALLRRLRQPRREPEPFVYRSSTRSDAEREERILELDRRVTSLEQRMSQPLWALISVLVALALGAFGGKLL